MNRGVAIAVFVILAVAFYKVMAAVSAAACGLLPCSPV